MDDGGVIGKDCGGALQEGERRQRLDNWPRIAVQPVS